MKKTYELLKEQYNIEQFSEPYVTERWYAVTGSIQCGGLTVSLHADLSRHYDSKETAVEGDLIKGKALDAFIKWNFSSKRSILRSFPVSEEGVKEACEWLDEKRQEFAQRILDGDEY